MKKTLLMLVAFMATMTAFASAEEEGWQRSFAPVADKADLAGMCTAVAADGSVYASSTYDQAFLFGGVNVTNPEGLLSSIILKYDKDGNEKWSVSLVGKCYVRAMAADTDGTLYVAAQSQDEKVVCTGTDGKSYEIVNPTSDIYGYSYSAFLLRIDPNGAIAATKTISSEANAELLTSMMYFPEKGDIYVNPIALRIAGDYLYVSANFTGDVQALGWYGSVLNVWDFMYQDNMSKGIFSCGKSDLAALQSEACVQNAESISYNQYFPEAIEFVVAEGKVFFSFIGFGNLAVKTPAGEGTYSFEMATDESGNAEHALVMLRNDQPNDGKVFHAAMHDKLRRPYNLVGGTMIGEKFYVSGTFYGNFPLDNSKYSVEKGVDPETSIMSYGNSSFVACIDGERNVAWSWVNPAESEATCMVVTGEEIHAATDAAMYTFKTATGELDSDVMPVGFEDASCYNDQYVSTIFTDGAGMVYVFCPKMKASGIAATKAAANNGNAKFYNLNGMELTGAQKGLNIVKTENGTFKVVK